MQIKKQGQSPNFLLFFTFLVLLHMENKKRTVRTVKIRLSQASRRTSSESDLVHHHQQQ
jgi:hypothetical protein